MNVSNCSTNTNGVQVVVFGSDGVQWTAHLSRGQCVSCYGVVTAMGPVREAMDVGGCALVVDGGGPGGTNAVAVFVPSWAPLSYFWLGLGLAIGCWCGLGAVRMARKGLGAGRDGFGVEG